MEWNEMKWKKIATPSLGTLWVTPTPIPGLHTTIITYNFSFAILFSVSAGLDWNEANI